MSDLLSVIFAPLLLLIEALMGLVLAAATILGEIVGFVLELLFHALFHGIASTKERYRQGPRKSADVPAPVITAIGSVGFVIFLAIGFTFLIHSGIQHSRTRTTQAEVDKLADAHLAQLEVEKDGPLTTDPTDQQDAWGHAIVLKTHDYVVGTQVVVRSDGPDGQPNTADDISAVRYHKTTASDIHDQLIDKAVAKFGHLFDKQDHDQAEQAAHSDASSVVPPAESDVDNTDADSQDQVKQTWKLPSLKFGWGQKDE